MERRDLLQEIGITGVGIFKPKDAKSANRPTGEVPFVCTLTPAKTAGPYPYPDSIAADYTLPPLYMPDMIDDLATAGLGSTISGGETAGHGIVLELTLTLENREGNLIRGAKIDIWHCDKHGYCSGYNSAHNGGNWTAYSSLRGIQTTDSNGQVNLTVLFPSWYVPRAMPFHIQAYINGTLYSNKHWIPLPYSK